jgi:hypothetical protein
MMRRSIVAAIVATLLLGGCATRTEPTQAELTAQWEERNVAPVNYKADLLAYMRTYLNDPTRIRGAAVSPPQRKTVIGNPGERYVACVRYDARKSGGDYAGVKVGAAVYSSGKLDRFLDTPRETGEICKDAAYQPFPELQQLTR